MYRIVLDTFCPKPLKWLECDHRDSDPENNILSNLRWVTRELNQVYIKHRGYTLRKNKAFTSYQPKFRKKSYATVRCPIKARAKYDQVRNEWIREERKRIVAAVMKRGCDQREAFVLLNWDARDLKGNQ